MVATARKLLADNPSDSDLRRAASTAYYALFHHLCDSFSSIVLHPEGEEFVRARQQTYRYIDHRTARRSCEEARYPARNFPAGIVRFAETFIGLQRLRLEADYDPAAIFNEESVRISVDEAERAIAAYASESIEAQRAFAIFVALRAKSRS
jgi:hypothetical protein